MTAEEWLAATDPTPMLDLLQGAASARRMALFAIAACRQDRWIMEDTRNREAVERAESVVEGLASWDAEDDLPRGELYLRAGAVNRCMLAAGCAAAGDTTSAVGHAFMVVVLLLEEENPEESSELAALMRDIFGNPFRPVTADPVWLTSTVVALAHGIYEDRAFDRLPILADALQDAGCDNAYVLDHCRSEGPHVRGCWVVDLLLGKS